MEENAPDNVDSSDANRGELVANPHLQKVYDLFSPLESTWPFFQEVLLWQKLEISVVCFNAVNILFWVFLTSQLQIIVGLAILVSLLWVIRPFRLWVLFNITSGQLTAKERESGNDDCEDLNSTELLAECGSRTSTQNKLVFYNDFCYGVAVLWEFFSKQWIRLKSIKEKSKYKFYGILVLVVVLSAVLYQRLPVGNIIYLTVMLLFLWPSIVFYGIKDKVTGKLRRLFQPFLTQWQNSRTKRKRNADMKDCCKDSDLSDDDEEFILNSSKETEAILSSAVPAERRNESPRGPYDSVDSSMVFTEGLEFPSIRRESVGSCNSDEFVEGLNFRSVNVDAGSYHSSMDSLVGETHESQSSEKEPIETTRNEEQILRSAPSLTLEQEKQEVRRRLGEHTSEPPLRNQSSDDLQDFEVVETSEIENDSVTGNNDVKSTETSYLASGVGYVGKFFGYS